MKSAVFGGTAALVAAYVGYHAEPTIEGTSIATTRAVVNASLLVLMFNFVLSALSVRQVTPCLESMSVRGPRLEFAVGAFLLLALASLLVLALASTNGKFGFGQHTYPLKARFTNLGQLRTSAPVKIGGVTIGNVADIQLDPVKIRRRRDPGHRRAATRTCPPIPPPASSPAACSATATSACNPAATSKP